MNYIDQISHEKIYYAHTCKNKVSETLKEHTDLTYKYYNLLKYEKSLSSIIERLIENIYGEEKQIITEMFDDAIILHDLGKINPSFQFNKMENCIFDKTEQNSNHSLLSSLLFIDFAYQKFKSSSINSKSKQVLKLFAYSFAYLISKHHGKLGDISPSDFMEKLSYFQKDFFIDRDIFHTVFELSLSASSNDFSKVFPKISKFGIPSFSLYILNKLLFSLIISSDYYATVEYMSDTCMVRGDFGVFSKDLLRNAVSLFENTDVIKSIRSKKYSNPINKLRSEMFLEAEFCLNNALEENIFYLEAPTGSGKTLTSINLALNILQKTSVNKIFYIFPFNTLIEQTKKVFDDIFSTQISSVVINSVTPMENKDTEDGYEKSYFDRLFMHHPIVLTTHIRLFDMLFGTSKESNFPLWQLANSVIIIDEIQSYNNLLWQSMVVFFQEYARALNIKIIIMSATLPRLDKLLDTSDGFVSLIADRSKYFMNPIFKDRVKINYTLLERDEITLDELEEQISLHSVTKKKILFEFIRKSTARDFYLLIKDSFPEFEIYELSGDDNKAFREHVISRTKEDIKIIIVATQVIEAGVDIDMDIGFKDISTLDSEEQFMGRINRNCLREGDVFFFDFDDTEKIYKNDVRCEYSIKKKEFQKLLETKNFSEFYRHILIKLKAKGDSFLNGLSTESEIFKSYIQKLQYSSIEKSMALITSEKTFSLFFPFQIDISEYNINEFKNVRKVFLTENYLDGQKVWDQFMCLQEIENYAENKVKSSEIMSFMQFFTFQIYSYGDSQPPLSNDYYRGFYFIKNYKEFITDECKFNRAEYLKLQTDYFL